MELSREEIIQDHINSISWLRAFGRRDDARVNDDLHLLLPLNHPLLAEGGIK